MAGRPEVLFPLFSKLDSLPGIGPKTASTLESAGIEAPIDLVMQLPNSGIDRSLRDSVSGALTGDTVTVQVQVGQHFEPRSKGRPYRIEVTDTQTTFFLVFFHAHTAYLKTLLPTGMTRIISGKLEHFDGVAQMSHPDHVLEVTALDEMPAFEPVYTLHGGITRKTMHKALAGALSRLPQLAEWVDPELLKQRKWLSWEAALQSAHRPTSAADVSLEAPARARLAYDEIFAHQVTLALARARDRALPGRSSIGSGERARAILAALPFAPTGAQTRATKQIVEDIASPLRMSRLLQGDVGSGKTLVALLAMVAVVEAKGQAVLMAPTEILARQHYEGLRPLAEQAGIVLQILTGRDKGNDRAAKLQALAAGDIHILVGTHAVFQSDVVFHDLRLAIIDEQHRFGVRQRQLLGQKNDAVDMLVMTATPIPRSLALAQFGDMDVSVLDEKPPGRSPVQTALVPTGRIDDVVKRLQTAIRDGRQAYWVCPLVEESEVIDLTSAEARFKQLRAEFGEERVGLVHGQMPAQEKDATMASFVEGKLSVLVATTVIEVGVNVPNASIMVIERAESFGLAQLHQLRGRVGRGAAQSTCLMLYKAQMSDTAEQRLRILRDSEDGFRIAEEDLRLRGAGDVIGTAQSGLPRFRIADIERQSSLMALAQSDARALLSKDPNLTSARGQAVRVLLWMMRQDRAFQLISVG